MFIFTPQVPKNDRKTKKIMISSDLLRLPWQHEIYDRNFKQDFLTIICYAFIELVKTQR